MEAHASRHLKGTEHYWASIIPNVGTNHGYTLDATTYMDPDRTGCTMTRTATTACSFTVRGTPSHHWSRTQTRLALSSGEAKLYGLSYGTTEQMGVLHFSKDCNVKANSYPAMAEGHEHTSNNAICTFRIWFLQVLFDREKVPMKDTLADLHTNFLPVERLQCLCELHHLRSSVVYYNIHTIMAYDHHAKPMRDTSS